MRFYPNGPNLPDELLEERDRGNIVFFCGAGVSRPAGLPGFLDLARQVIEQLQPPADAKSRLLLARAQADPDFAPPLDQVFSLLQQEYTAAVIEDVVSQLLATPRDADIAQHEIVLRLSRNAANKPQVVTTNFDLLFERADKSIAKHVPPALPDLASGQQPIGVVYLHGRRATRPTHGITRLGLILSSADFGRAYLADAWATRCARELLRSYVIVLLGYSANDPPVRYLLEGLHSRGHSTSSAIYAFDQGSDEEVAERWRNRGVKPLAYPPSDTSHSALWDSLRAWAERADDPDTWRRTVIGMAAQGPRSLTPCQRGQIASVARTVAGAKLFADIEPSPPAEWLCVFDRSARYAEPRTSYGDDEPFDPLENYGLDGDPPRPSKAVSGAVPTGVDLLGIIPEDERSDRRKRLAGLSPRESDALPPRLFYLARWFGKLLNDPTSAWWVAPYHAVHTELLQHVAWRLEQKEAPLHARAYNVWSLLLDKFRDTANGDRDEDWYGFVARLAKEGWSRRSLRDFERVIRPRLSLRRHWSSAPRPPAGTWHDLSLHDIAEWKIKFQNRELHTLKICTDKLPDVFKCARGALERAAGMLGDIDARFWRTTTLHPQEPKVGERYLTGADRYFLWVARLFDRLSAEHPHVARQEVQYWPSEDPFFFAKLSIYAWTKSGLFSEADVTSGLLALSPRNFWEPYYRRELLHTLRARWSDFSDHNRSEIEALIITGPSRGEREDDADYATRRAVESATMLGWLRLEGCQLSAATIAQLPALRAVNPSWHPSWDASADDSHEARGGAVHVVTDPSTIIDLPLSQLIPTAAQHSRRDYAELTNYRPFQGVVQQRPSRAVAALAFQARQRVYPPIFWSTALVHWPDATSERLRWLFARRLARLPPATIAELRYDIPSWLEKHLPALAQSSPANALRIYDAVVERLASCGEEVMRSGIVSESIAGEPQNYSRRTWEHAVSSPTGRVAQLLFRMLDDLKVAAGAGLPPEFGTVSSSYGPCLAKELTTPSARRRGGCDG